MCLRPYLAEGREGGQAVLGQPGLWFSVEVGLHQTWQGFLTCWLPSHIDPESHVRKTLVFFGRHVSVPCLHFCLRFWTAGPVMLPQASTLESFAVIFVLVLQNNKVEEKKHRSPQGDKQTKEILLKCKIYLEIKVGFHQAKTLKPLSPCCLSRKATEANWL